MGKNTELANLLQNPRSLAFNPDAIIKVINKAGDQEEVDATHMDMLAEFVCEHVNGDASRAQTTAARLFATKIQSLSGYYVEALGTDHMSDLDKLMVSGYASIIKNHTEILANSADLTQEHKGALKAFVESAASANATAAIARKAIVQGLDLGFAQEQVTSIIKESNEVLREAGIQIEEEVLTPVYQAPITNTTTNETLSWPDTSSSFLEEEYVRPPLPQSSPQILCNEGDNQLAIARQIQEQNGSAEIETALLMSILTLEEATTTAPVAQQHTDIDPEILAIANELAAARQDGINRANELMEKAARVNYFTPESERNAIDLEMTKVLELNSTLDSELQGFCGNNGIDYATYFG